MAGKGCQSAVSGWMGWRGHGGESGSCIEALNETCMAAGAGRRARALGIGQQQSNGLGWGVVLEVLLIARNRIIRRHCCTRTIQCRYEVQSCAGNGMVRHDA